ncbi:MAG TPA: family 43 glycosylhydrolase [Pseudonocardiaceae bacterium]|nr:family 43 glycosylhydrolase [Pseudonocardiaceae bacterium]
MLIAVVAVGLGYALPAEAATDSDGAPTPIIIHDFPDPSVLQTPYGDYAYSTNSHYGDSLVNIPEARAPKLTGPWTDTGTDALPVLPNWVTYDPGDGTNDVWAPDVSRLDDGGFIMYYVAHNENGLQCLGAAGSRTPAGPFTPIGPQPLLCNADDHGDIDPATYTLGGRHYLIYKDNANSAGIPNSIWINQVADDGVTFIGGRTKLLTADPAGNENNVAEAPFIIRHNGEYVLLYSADDWNSTYHMKYAVSRTLTGPYTKQGTFTDTETWNGAIVAPGGDYVVVTGPDGTDYLFFHGNVGTGRGLYVDRLNWPHDVPTPAGAPPLAPGTYQFTALTTGQTLAVPGSGDTWQLTAGPDRGYRIVSRRTGLVLSTVGPDGHALLTQLPFVGLPGQLWNLDRDFAGYYRIRSAATGELLTLGAFSPTLSANDDDPAQKWLPTTE